MRTEHVTFDNRIRFDLSECRELAAFVAALKREGATFEVKRTGDKIEVTF